MRRAAPDDIPVQCSPERTSTQQPERRYEHRVARLERHVSSPLLGKRGRRGTAMLELALIGPWIFFLFIGALDWGLIAYSLISLQTATRTAATYTSTDATKAADASGACKLVLAEMRKVSNVGTGVTTCTAAPVVVTVCQRRCNNPQSTG